jgi:hypothetical protein
MRELEKKKALALGLPIATPPEHSNALNKNALYKH